MKKGKIVTVGLHSQRFTSDKTWQKWIPKRKISIDEPWDCQH